MKANRFAWGLGLLLVLFSTVPPLVADQPAATNDSAAVRATVTNYIEAYYTADAARMEKTLHPHYLKHTISNSAGRTRMTEKSGLEMVQELRNHKPVPDGERKQQVTVLDVAGDIASAKLETSHWTDYVTLTKVNGEWKIVSVVLRENF
jgi:hypothetical protein